MEERSISPLADVGRIIAVSSCKGGVGKSTMAAHMALDLAARGLKVGLLDADIYGPSVPALFQIPYHRVQANAQQQFIPVDKYGLKLLSFGFLLGDQPAVMRGPIVTRYIQQLLMSTAWGKLDYLLIDMPPGTGDIQLTITQSIRLNGAVIVTTPQTLSLVDVARGILMFEKVNVHINGIIDNMAYFTCTECETRHYPFGVASAEQLHKRFGVPVLGEIPVNAGLSGTIDGPEPNPFVHDAVSRLLEATAQKTGITRPQVAFDKEFVTLRWPEGEVWTVGNRNLRLASRDALSVDEVSGRQLIKPEDIAQDIHPKEISLLGNYAIGVTWSDGHSAAIYPYPQIKALAGKS